tara:strand:+ start:2372 stop:2746 length:375 start_codon:yes stop_codon:yes gene_type:complete
MSLFLEVKKETYGKTRRVSAGAGITLVCKSGEYIAMFECAKRVAEVLGSRGLAETLDGILESAPAYAIPMEDMPGALEKLSRQFSVALVDIGGNGFSLVHRIERKSAPAGQPEQAKEAVNLDEF